MEKEEYTEKNIEYLDDLSNNVSDIKTILIVLTIIQCVVVLVIGGLIFMLVRGNV